MKKTVTLLVIVLLFVFGWYLSKQDTDNVTANILKTQEKQIETPKAAEPTHTTENKKALKPFTAVEKNDHKVVTPNMQTVEPINADNASAQKEVIQDLELRMTTQMKNIPNCLEQANTKKEALACTKELRELNYELALILGMGTASDIEDPKLEENFMWNESTKENMIEELDAGIVVMQEMFSCIQNATTDKARQQCFGVEE